MQAEDIITPILTFVFGVGGIKAFDAWKDWRKGRLATARECWKIRDEAVQAQEEAERKARIVVEALHRLRVVAIRHGIPEDEIGKWPDY